MENITTIDSTLRHAVAQAVTALYGTTVTSDQIVIQTTKREFEGHYTVVTFAFAKMARKSPDATACELGDYLQKNCPIISKYNVVKGFLNLTIAASEWLTQYKAIAQDTNWGFTPVTATSPLVMIEYSSPNTNKPLHLGHIRNNLLGYSLAQIMAANGNRVVKTNIVNDRGIHICKSMLAWQKWGNGATPESTGLKGDHLIGDYYVEFDKHYKQEVADLMATGLSKEQAEQQSPLMLEAREMLRKWEAGDTEVRNLWQTMNQWVYTGFDETYRRLGVDFDKIYYESQTYLVGRDKVLQGLDQGIFTRDPDNSVWADLTAEGLDRKILLRSDGTSVYMTQDIGTAQMRFTDYKIDKMIYVVGNEQDYHFQVLSILLDKLGFSWGKDLIHFSYGMVELPSGKMKSREGTVVDADDLMDDMVQTARQISEETEREREKNNQQVRMQGISPEERDQLMNIIGLGALKYYMLKVEPRRGMMFNPEESIDFNGNTGPFIQYTYARIRSVLRRAEEEQLPQADYTQITLCEKEINVIQRLLSFPDIVQAAGNNYSPALIAAYSYDLAKDYNQFYHDLSILRESDVALRTFRLQLSATVADTLRRAFSLLGIEVPERM